jgi:hypothetical protein
MFKMNNLGRTLLAGATLITSFGFSGQASALVIGGINVGTTGSVSLQDVSAETVVTQAGNTLLGVGHITAVNNGFNFAAAGLELNFVYSANVAFDNGSTIIFDTGSLNFFVNTSGTYNIGSFASMAAAQAAVQGGTDWLDLVTTTVDTIAPYNVALAPTTGGFFGTGTNLGGSNPNGSGVGYMSVDNTGTGLANGYFDTDSLTFNGTTPYDFLFTSTFSVPVDANNNPTNPAWGIVQDASTFTGTYSVPEPGTLALMGLGCLVTVIGYRRRKPQATGTMAA